MWDSYWWCVCLALLALPALPHAKIKKRDKGKKKVFGDMHLIGHVALSLILFFIFSFYSTLDGCRRCIYG